MNPKRKVLILGATSAIASQAAKHFAIEGADLFLVARDEKKLKALCADLIAHGAAQAFPRIADLNNFSDHEALLKEAQENLGVLDIVLLAHGTLGDQERCEKSYLESEKEIRTNFLSVVSILTPLANYMEEKRSGCIAVISSVAGDRGRQSNYIYGTAKGAVSLYLQGLRNRLFQSGVQVLTVKPGFVDTPMTAAFPKGPLFVGADVIGEGIYNAINRRKDVVYLPWFWFFIMTLIKAFPERLFKRLKL